MNQHQLQLVVGGHEIALSINSPSGLAPIEDYREVNFVLPGQGRRRAVFFLLPDKNSSDPFATKPEHEWHVPVRWDDPTMLFIPDLSDRSILAAIKHIIDHKLEDEAFENEDDIERSGG